MDFIGGGETGVGLYYSTSDDSKFILIEIRFTTLPPCKDFADITVRAEEAPEHRVFDYILARCKNPEQNGSTTIRITSLLNEKLRGFLQKFGADRPFDKSQAANGNFQSSISYRMTFQRAVKAEYEEQKHDLLSACRNYYDLNGEFIPAATGADDWYHIRLRVPPGRPLQGFQIDVTAGMEFRLLFGKAIKLGKQYFKQDRKFTVTYSDEQAIKESMDIVLAGLIYIPKNIFPTEHTGFYIEPCMNKTMYKRLKNALKIFDHHAGHDSAAGNIHQEIYSGLPVRGTIPMSDAASISNKIENTRMDEIQKQSAKVALQNQLTIIQGPPGTGKTFVTTNIVTLCLQAGLGPVLATAPSNTATDHLTSSFYYHVKDLGPEHQNLLDRAVRFTSTSEMRKEIRLQQQLTDEEGQVSESESECDAPPNSEKEEMSEAAALDIVWELEDTAAKKVPVELTMNYKRQKIDPTWNQRLEKYLKKDMTEDEEIAFHTLRTDLTTKVLSQTDILFTTCATAGSYDISKYHASVVVVDEAGQSNEPETLIPLTSCCLSMGSAILIGDHLQLPPFTMHRIGLLASSMIRRLAISQEKGGSGVTVTLLRKNYRSVAPLVHHTSAQFYQNRLIPSISTGDPFWNNLWASTLGTTASIIWVNSVGPDERLPTQSVRNLTNAEIVARILRRLDRGATNLGFQLSAEHVGVITMYKGQTETVERFVSDRVVGPVKNCTIGNVDFFQGHERPVIIVDLVRNNDPREIGFLRRPERINVALSRARYKTIVVGNIDMYAQSLWFNSIPCQSLFDLASEVKTGKVGCDGTTPHCYHDMQFIQGASL
ncbi:hypothetical protein TWF481_009290 [Arthrobotrys musiformis]|uniref:Uncharacterized protein n=1 Tax=Arthrobotrys musiformis TaxID=47236 RepID=A0AAV9W585_9PEZI